MEQAGFLLSLTGLLTLAGGLATLLGRRNSRKLVDQLRKDASTLAAERDAAEQQARQARAAADDLDPGVWMKRALQERAQGNEELAIAVLEAGFERVRPGMAAAGMALAGHQLSLLVGPDPLRHLEEGERFAQLAVLLDPNDTDAAFLLEEARLVRTQGEVEAIPSLAASFIPADPDEIRALINAINSRAQDFFEIGSYRLALRLFRRSLLLVYRAGITDLPLGQLVRMKVCESELQCGEYRQALDGLQKLLQLQERTLPSADEEVFRSRYLLANLRFHMGDHEEAFSSMRESIEAYLPAVGATHPYILAARAQEASFMAVLGKPEESLDCCEQLLPQLSSVCGPNHPNTLVTRQHRAYALIKLQRHDDALAEITALLPLQTHILGPDHPTTLGLRKLEAEVLHELGQSEQALAMVSAVILDMERVEGPSHPHVGYAEELRDEIIQVLEANP